MKFKTKFYPLTKKQKEEFFGIHGHLAYRHTMLWAHKERVDNGIQMEYALQICAFEAALISCRMFMDFLGLGIAYQPKLTLIEKRGYFSIGGRTDEVKVVDLGGNFIDLYFLKQDEIDLLARIYHMASKSTAHFTYQSKPITDPRDLGLGIILIDKLLKKNLYDVVKRPVRKHGK